MRRQIALGMGVLLLVLVAWPGIGLALGFGSLANADAKFLGQYAADVAGTDVAAAGDVNGDGLGDIFVGAPEAGLSNEGVAYLVLGSNTPMSDSLANAIVYTGEVTDDRAGYSVAGAGDVNNDGFDDLLVGAYVNDAAAFFAGAAYLILGSAEPVSDSLSSAIRFTGEEAEDWAGSSVAGAGDVNNDGFDDFLVGALQNGAGGSTYSGAAYLILGSATPTGGSLSSAIRYTGGGGLVSAGRSVAGAGDVNNDGFDDFLVGGEGDETGGSFAGAAYLVLGSATPAGGPLANNIRYAGQERDQAGRDVAGAGDVNNDGFDDLLIGAQYNEAGGDDAGAAYLVLGSAAPASGTLASAIRYTGALGEFAGTSVAGAGDINGDGYADLLVGAPDSNLRAGAAYLIMGSATPAGGALADHSSYGGEVKGDQAGMSVAGAGDINGDGLDDMLVGAMGSDLDQQNTNVGAAYLVLGEGSPTALTLQEVGARSGGTGWWVVLPALLVLGLCGVAYRLRSRG